MLKVLLNPETHIYTDEAGRIVPGVTDVLNGVGIPDFSMISAERLAAAQERGTNVHKICELHDLGRLDGVDLEANNPLGFAYLQSWIKVRAELELKEFQAIERIVSHSAGYAGMLDRVSGKYLIDIKTGAWQSSGPQLAAYDEAYREMEGIKKPFERLIICLEPDGYKPVRCENQTDISIFHSALNIWRFKNDK